MSEISILIGGILSLGLGVFHVLFDRIFKWDDDLKKMSQINSKIFYTLHIFLIPVFFLFAAISLIFTIELLESRLGLFLTGFYALFWLARGLWQQFYFIPSQVENIESKFLYLHHSLRAVSLLLVISYGYPVIATLCK